MWRYESTHTKWKHSRGWNHLNNSKRKVLCVTIIAGQCLRRNVDTSGTSERPRVSRIDNVLVNGDAMFTLPRKHQSHINRPLASREEATHKQTRRLGIDGQCVGSSQTWTRRLHLQSDRIVGEHVRLSMSQQNINCEGRVTEPHRGSETIWIMLCSRIVGCVSWLKLHSKDQANPRFASKI